MAFKKYLNKKEKEDLYLFTYFCDNLEEIIEGWSSRGNLSAEEKRDLDKALNLSLKSYKSILDRIDNTSKISFVKALEQRKVYIDLPYVINSLDKQRQCDLNGIYEKNADWLTLIELSMERACLNCKTKCGECDLFRYFEIKNIPSFYVETDEMAKEHKNCKYAYDLNFLKATSEKIKEQQKEKELKARNIREEKLKKIKK